MQEATLNRLFVVNKPILRSSNGYMGHIKRKYNTKKVGFSGTLDPFATGCLIVATGKYTKLFRYLAKTPKTYRATLWLGAFSPSFDIENIQSIKETLPLSEDSIRQALHSLKGELTYLPPKYSAKSIGGRRAYDLARAGKEVRLREIISTIYEIDMIQYTHPFVHFEVTVSEGTYVRSLGQIAADKLGVPATLSSLHRVREGEFRFDNEKAIDPFAHLSIPNNIYTGDDKWLELGKKLHIHYFEDQSDGEYLVETANFFAIISIRDGQVGYLLNRLEKFDPKV
jgi:tRNA pseudouridine55 synthase